MHENNLIKMEKLRHNTTEYGHINGKNPAFQSSLGLSNSELAQMGLTKREYFAGLAMRGMLSNSQLVGYLNTKDGAEDAKVISKASVFIADELLKQLDEK